MSKESNAKKRARRARRSKKSHNTIRSIPHSSPNPPAPEPVLRVTPEPERDRATMRHGTVPPPPTDMAERIARLPVPRSDAPMALEPRESNRGFGVTIAIAAIGMIGIAVFLSPPTEKRDAIPLTPAANEVGYTIEVALEELPPVPAATVTVQPETEETTVAPAATVSTTKAAAQQTAAWSDLEHELHGRTDPATIQHAAVRILGGNLPPMETDSDRCAARIAFGTLSRKGHPNFSSNGDFEEELTHLVRKHQ